MVGRFALALDKAGIGDVIIKRPAGCYGVLKTMIDPAGDQALFQCCNGNIKKQG